VKGEVDRHEFKAETRMLLDIVAKSLYSENEVFVRELISNSSDAIEKFRYLSNTSPDEIEGNDRTLEIHLETNKQNQTLIIQDTGVGEFMLFLYFSPLNQNLGESRMCPRETDCFHFSYI
jgi:TNF receptor-associated protein 1